jgi:medium-chain acyl-[acyl-carrier-protein] hydrolase
LFCFSYAGGTSEAYRQWQPDLREHCLVCPVELPGRGARFGEPFIESLAEAAAQAAEAIAAYADRPYALFGHSLGSVTALETARGLERLKAPPPLRLIVSGRYPPHVAAARKNLHRLDDAAIVKELRRLGGTPEDVLVNSDFLDMLLPIVRDDFRLLETHSSPDGPQLPMPVSVCCGRNDHDSPPHLLQRWAEITENACDLTLFPGGHFYIQDRKNDLLSHLKNLLADDLDASWTIQ